MPELLPELEDAPFYPEADKAQASEPGHQVKIAAEVKVGKARFYVVECRCGWDTPLLGSPFAANQRYAAHKEAAAIA